MNAAKVQEKLQSIFPDMQTEVLDEAIDCIQLDGYTNNIHTADFTYDTKLNTCTVKLINLI